MRGHIVAPPEREDTMKQYRSDTWQDLEIRWIAAKADLEDAKARLTEAEAALKSEVSRRGDVPAEPGERIDIDGVRTSIIFRLNAGRTTVDSARLKTEQPDIYARYSKTGKPSPYFKVAVKTAAALADIVGIDAA
jgi:hypothetical protein